MDKKVFGFRFLALEKAKTKGLRPKTKYGIDKSKRNKRNNQGTDREF